MTPDIPEKRKLRDSVLFKMIVTGLLILALAIPLMMVRGLIYERQHRRDTVVSEVAGTWGREQTLGGPVLTVPYLVHSKDEKGKVTTWTQLAHFLPETLTVDGRLHPELRRRGIFEVAVYRADLHASGTFQKPSFAEWGIPPQDILWDKAWLSIGVPDMRGIRRNVRLLWGGRMLQLAPGGGVSGLWNTGLRVPISGLAQAPEKQAYPFAFDLALRGSQELQFLPFAKQNVVRLRSSWPDPSFSGGFLPDRREVSQSGFEATWTVPYFGRSYPQQWLETERERLVPEAAVQESAFGVELYLPVDVYQKTERSVKYGLLFLILTFLAFFLFEVFSPVSLHPMHYLLVGSALCLFYVLLLSISEHIPFGASYAIASAGIIVLIAGYSFAILRGARRALAMSGMLVILYSYLYVLLQAEDYALLLGSLGLFVILALVMFLTRRVDWYSPRMGRSTAP
ncbi:MAG TPA: cell envelope integrity protein CreD [Thermoanaerobaculia bacterium]|nr:cell envelope integrity protein CreD [Thermoanaerobaculia bacterium]